jgi:hypothetical protein
MNGNLRDTVRPMKKAERMYLAGMRVVCDARGHRWLERTDDEGHRSLYCRRCHLHRSGSPVPPAA